MEVQVQRSSVVLARGNPNAMETQVPLTIFDRFAYNLQISVLFAFTAPMPSNAALLDGLSKTILHFPTLTGKLGYSPSHRRPCVILGSEEGGGALVVEATVSSELSDHLPLEPSAELRQLHASPINDAQLFQVQINRFKCGGVVIGATAHHKVADGHSMSIFFFTWSQIVRGMTVDRLPVYDRSWLAPRRPPRCEFEHWGVDFMSRPTANPVNADPSEITNVLVRYSSDYIKKLKATVNNKYSTVETLLGHVWRKITIARGLQDSDHTMVRVSVNGRTRLNPPVPNEFFGNLVLNAYPKANVKQLIAGGLAGAASIVHEAILKIDERYYQSFMDFGASYGDEELLSVYDVDGNVLSPTLEMDSWVRLRFQDMDFGGGGGLRGFLPGWVAIEGLVIFLPGLGDEGGIDVFVGLFEEHAELLRQISHSLD